MFQRVLLLASCLCALLAACDRQPTPPGESPQVSAAKSAVAKRLDTSETIDFADVVEYRDGVVCGRFNSKKKYSGTDIGYRTFIYNAPEAGQMVIDNGDLSPQELDFWCSEQPDKRLRMLTASVAELTRACEAAGNKAGDMRCRLAATQKQTLAELQAAKGSAPAQGPASATVAAAPASTGTVTSPTASVPPSPATVASAATTARPAASAASAVAGAAPASAPTTAGQRPAPGDKDAAIVAEVGAALQTWRERWQEGDVEGYLRMYEPSFTGGAASHAAWEQQRRQKMRDVRPSIRVEGLQAVRVTPQEVELRFVQVYAARQHRDRGSKTMVFRRSPQGWLVADERWARLP